MQIKVTQYAFKFQYLLLIEVEWSAKWHGYWKLKWRNM